MQEPDNSSTPPLDDLFSVTLSTDPLNDPDHKAFLKERTPGAERLRAALCSVPWYAKKAQRVKERTGDEMDYWRDLFGSEATLIRKPLDSSTAEAE